MMVKGKASTLSGLVNAKSSTLSGLGLWGLRGLGDDDGGGDDIDTSIDNQVSDNPEDTPYEVYTGPSGQITSNTPAGTSGGSTNWGNVLSSLFGAAASTAQTALKSTTQTCQVINGTTVCTTSSTGGVTPVNSAGVLGFGGSSSILLVGLAAVVVLVVVAGKK
jgi:hypothetical protein